MHNHEVVLQPEAYDFLYDLAQTLYDENYVSGMEHGLSIIDDILNFIKTIPYVPKYNLSPIAQSRFKQYGRNMQYTFFKRKSSKQTTWYIFFSRQNDRYIIRYITNNHRDGKYIRNYIMNDQE